MNCQDCGANAETKYVEFHQNIGALIVRFPSTIEGYFCKSCIHKHFWSTTTTTFFLGWWGTISFIMTPCFLLNNIGRYLFCLGMSSGSSPGTLPALSEQTIEKIKPYFSDLISRLNAGEDLKSIAELIAPRAGVTPRDVMLFVRKVIQS